MLLAMDLGGRDVATGAFCRLPSGGPAAQLTLPFHDDDASARRDRFVSLLR